MKALTKKEKNVAFAKEGQKALKKKLGGAKALSEHMSKIRKDAWKKKRAKERAEQRAAERAG